MNFKCFPCTKKRTPLIHAKHKKQSPQIYIFLECVAKISNDKMCQKCNNLRQTDELIAQKI